MIVAGVDYSMSSPSICVYDTESGDLSHQNCFYFYKQVVPSIKEMNRICQLDLVNIFPGYQSKFEDEFTKVFCLADWGYSIIREMKVELVALEGYAFGASGRVFNIAEATGLFKMFLRLNKIPLLTFAPSQIKKVFSGKGNSNKNAMIKFYNDKYSVNMWDIFGVEEKDETPIADLIDSHAILYTYLELKS